MRTSTFGVNEQNNKQDLFCWTFILLFYFIFHLFMLMAFNLWDNILFDIWLCWCNTPSTYSETIVTCNHWLWRLRERFTIEIVFFFSFFIFFFYFFPSVSVFGFDSIWKSRELYRRSKLKLWLPSFAFIQTLFSLFLFFNKRLNVTETNSLTLLLNIFFLDRII